MNDQELLRYSRHILLDDIGIEGQEKILSSHVVVIGAGGLGSAAAPYLAAAGVGKITLIDHDVVDLTNLQRQVLYKVEDIGNPKALVATKRLLAMNDSIEVEAILHRLKKENALQYIQQYDIVVDCTDNFTTRYLINDICVKLNKPFVYGAIHQFEGQVSVFNYTDASGQQGPTYRCLFPEQPSELEIPNCATIGVLGILPGTLGMYQANEVVKMVTGIGKVLSGEFLMIDLLENTSRKIKVKRRPDAEQLAQHGAVQEQEEIACKTNIMKTLSVEELQEKLEAQEELFLLDVRNTNEYEICHLENAVLIPMNHVPNNI